MKFNKYSHKTSTSWWLPGYKLMTSDQYTTNRSSNTLKIQIANTWVDDQKKVNKIFKGISEVAVKVDI